MLTLYHAAEPGTGWFVIPMALTILVTSMVSGHALHSFVDFVFWGETWIDRIVQAAPADTGAWAGLTVGALICLG